MVQDNFYHSIGNGKKIVLLWILSHVGSPGNETVDQADKEAIS